MSNKMIGTCKYCDENYCMECSTNKNWKEFCSDECEREYNNNQKSTDEILEQLVDKDEDLYGEDNHII
ncbi:MAG: hypothetical protein ABSG25_01530 [Bryobacteraceae bacterium]